MERGYIGIMEKKMDTTIVYWDYIGIMEKKMETTTVYWDYGMMEKKVETTIVYWDYMGIVERKVETTMPWLARSFFLQACRRPRLSQIIGWVGFQGCHLCKGSNDSVSAWVSME